MKQKSKLKMWVGVGVGVVVTGVAGTICAQTAFADGEQGEKGEKGSAETSGAFQGKFGRALELMFMGEGGEGGLGLSKMRPTVSVPALTGDEIEKTIPGNTLAIPYHYALQFNKNGKVGGYTVEYKVRDNVNECPKIEDPSDNYLLYEGVCSLRTEVKWSGKWKVKNDRLCMSVKWPSGAENDCYYVALMLDRVALFKSNGDLSAKGHVLKKGLQGDM